MKSKRPVIGKEPRINQFIRAREVRVVDENGGQRGILQIDEAVKAAKQAGLDLVEVAPQASPPVCKIIDYGKHKFEQEKKIRESKKKQKLSKLKEITMYPKIHEHDLQFKTKHIREFLDDGNKVKVTVRFRGRELAHTEMGRQVIEKIVGMIENPVVMEKPPRMEGRRMSVVLSPKPRR